jgi:alkanesulfonate monooxygenase SsuD/methylene tetrahydromethanopterin reductase-like flavin-dependent oxidoreductase (luciferase family)
MMAAGGSTNFARRLEAAKYFGRDAHLEHAVRYARAREFFDVVTGL